MNQPFHLYLDEQRYIQPLHTRSSHRDIATTIMSEPDEATISYSSIAFVLGLAFIIYRYFSAPSSDATPSSGPRPQGQRYTEAQLDQVTAMFPQMSRRDIAWDLQRNRGNVNATVERVLGGRGLDAVSRGLHEVTLSVCMRDSC